MCLNGCWTMASNWFFRTVVCFVVCGGQLALADEGLQLYQKRIKPLLKRKCLACHGAVKQAAQLRLDTGTAILAGGENGPVVMRRKPDQSELMSRVASTDDDRMPPEGEPLTRAELDLIRTWIKQGAAFPEQEQGQADPKSHWAFQPIPASTKPLQSSDIDAMIDRGLRGIGLSRSPPADAIALIRRSFFDLHGLPPTPAQIDHWRQRLDKLPARSTNYSQLLNLLLASPRYGERWGQHWLDVVRYADTHGYEVNTPRPNAWPYRDYVIRAFNEDKPYDRFVFEQLAGDQVGADPATGFLVAAAALLPGQIGADEASKRLARQDALDEIVVGTGATFLGLTVGCARCHDHKFDPISQHDYYGMQAFFAGVLYGDRPYADDAYRRRLANAEKLTPVITDLAQDIAVYQQRAFIAKTLVIDDEQLDQVTLLQKKNGHGVNPAGKQRGYRDDVGDSTRMPNLGRGRYTWWPNRPGVDVFTWNPATAGRFRVWMSWGVHGSGVHTRDARYVFDRDGDLSTRQDQVEMATIDQFYFAGQKTGDSPKVPRWSGFQDFGVYDFGPQSRIVLRGGKTGTGITADVLVMQAEATDANEGKRLPKLRGPVTAGVNTEWFPAVTAKFIRFTSQNTSEKDRYEPCIDELEVFGPDRPTINLAAAKRGAKPTSSGNYANSGKHQLKHINDGRYGNSYSWISNEKGRGWVQIEFPQSEKINHVKWSRDRQGKFGDRLPVVYQIQVSADGKNWRQVSGSMDRVAVGSPYDKIMAVARNAPGNSADKIQAMVQRLQSLRGKQQQLKMRPVVYAGNFRMPDVTHLLNRGDPEQPGKVVAPRVPRFIDKLELAANAKESQRRRSLADWIVSPRNPLTARVMVNRIWLYHFGRGLVSSPSDFGLNGSSPSHPQLLDRLAAEFARSGWSIKHMHLLIMQSQAYQQSSQVSEQGKMRDADVRLLWRYPSRRLEAEAIRDSVLAASGNLNLKMGGPGFDFFRSRGGLSGFPIIEKFASEGHRRMIYSHKIRMERVPIFGAFDCPDAGQATPKRSQSTTAIQALNLFNSQFMLAQAKRLASRVEREAGEGVRKQIDLAFRLALGRVPSESELGASLRIAKQHGLATVCRALFNSNEFLFIP